VNWNRRTIHIPQHEPCRCGYCRRRAQQETTHNDALSIEDAVASRWHPKTVVSARLIPFDLSLRLELCVECFANRYDARDVDVAQADGYGFFGIVPRAGIVYENLIDYLVDFVDTGDLDHTDPPALLFYVPSEDVEDQDDVDDSTIVLAGVEWLVSGRHEEAPANIVDDENSARALKVTEEEGWHPAPDPNLNFTGLHAWVHMANPNGMFARDHPIMIKRLTG
jgi:hypothetical protein